MAVEKGKQYTLEELKEKFKAYVDEVDVIQKTLLKNNYLNYPKYLEGQKDGLNNTELI